MDQNTKQRLVGITVIFALAVIFLPMILDGSGVQRETLTVDIPVSFELDENPEFDQKIVELHASVDGLPTIHSGFIDEQSVVIDERVGGEVEALAELNKSKSDQAKNRTETKAKKSERVVSKAVAATKSEIKIVKQNTGGESYVLQVGSFEDQTKALLQRDKLRKSKIAAVFVEKFNAFSKPSYRVRLGPFVNRNLSKIAQNKVKAKHNLDGLIMKYEQ
ncbi:MAG: DedD protein [Gammaproteobacteria bacterium]|jgi:DedD protein